MTDRHTNIGDDEIRVITSAEPDVKRKNRPHVWLCILGAVALFVLLLVFFVPGKQPTAQTETVKDTVPVKVAEPVRPTVSQTPLAADKVMTVCTDTVVNGVALSILTPVNATAELSIGAGTLDDSTAVLVAPAADVRADNGKIVGMFVLRGDVLAKGESKAGFCSIVNGKVTVGVADATPMLEQALETDGYLFRQYPLVVGGQIVENKPKGRSLRKALAEIGDNVHVVVSRERLTFHDFSQALVDIGASNAIYIQGSTAAGFYVDAEGVRHDIGSTVTGPDESRSFIVWR